MSHKKPVTITTLNKFKESSEKFTCLTAYESTMASVISQSGVDVILVGDSLGMVIQGHDSTLPVTMDQLIYHLECVVNGNEGSHIMADMPFMSYATDDLFSCIYGNIPDFATGRFPARNQAEVINFVNVLSIIING